LRQLLALCVALSAASLSTLSPAAPVSIVFGSDVALLSARFCVALTVFLVVMTNLLLLIGAGLFSKAVWDYQENAFNHLCALFFVDSVMLEADIQAALAQM
jgi:high-affinity iron transporter